MKKLAQALFLALVVAAPVALSAPLVQAKTPQGNTVQGKTSVAFAPAAEAKRMKHKGRKRRKGRRPTPRTHLTSMNTHFMSNAHKSLSRGAKQA